MSSTSTDRGDKRPRLVRAATAVFAEKGYAATRVSDIAERAGIGKGTVYEYFTSKKSSCSPSSSPSTKTSPRA